MVIALWGVAASSTPPPPEPLTAVLVGIHGQVTVTEAASAMRTRRGVRPGRDLQVLRAGEIVHVSAGSRAGLVCSTDHKIFLSGKRDWIVAADACRTGRPLPAGSYSSLAFQRGRLRTLHGALVLERKTRGIEDEHGGIPVILSPRNTALRQARPRIVWTPVVGAVRYELELVGQKKFKAALDAAPGVCGPGTGAWTGEEVCSAPFPAAWPDLEPAGTAFLSIGAQTGIASPLRWAKGPNSVWRLSAAQEEAVRTRLDAVKAAAGDDLSRQLLTAGVYAENNLYAETLEAYREALTVQVSTPVQVAVGDVYVLVGLSRRAYESYRKALAGNPEGPVKAAAELGLGLIGYARNHPGEAREHLLRARQLYFESDLREEASEVETILKEIESAG